MKLIIENVAKIGHADLSLDGLTVIIGDNNMGKSTVGRTLFTMFHSLYNPRVDVSRLRRKLFFSYAPQLSRLRRDLSPDALIARAGELTEEDCEELLLNIELMRREREFGARGEPIDITYEIAGERYIHRPIPWKGDAERKEYAGLILAGVRHVASYSADKILGSVVADGFRDVFSGQYRPLFKGAASSPHVRLEFRGGFIDYGLDGEMPLLKSEGVEIQHDAVLIASPLLMNAVSSEYGYDALEPAHRPLITKLRRPDDSETLFKEMIRGRMLPVSEVIDSHFLGSFTPSKSRGGLKIDLPNLSDPLKAVNLSMGLKSFGIIKLMLERQILHDEDVLILDEPENHLHPEWQLAYAEAIVLLQRVFGLTILLTTHSPFFLEAIQLYSKKYEEKDEKCRLHVYEPTVLDADGRIGMKEISDDEEALFGKFSNAFRELDVVRAMLADPANAKK